VRIRWPRSTHVTGIVGILSES